MASVSLLIPSLPGANREAAEAWDALATHAGKQASVCRYGAELAGQDRPRPFGRTAGPRRLSGPFLANGGPDTPPPFIAESLS